MISNPSDKPEYKHSRIFKRKKQCSSFVSVYMLTDYEIKNTSYEREYQGRIATSSQYTIYYNYPLDK